MCIGEGEINSSQQQERPKQEFLNAIIELDNITRDTVEWIADL